MATRGAAQQVSTRMTKGVYGLVLHKVTETKGQSARAQTQAASTEHQQIISENRIERKQNPAGLDARLSMLIIA